MITFENVGKLLGDEGYFPPFTEIKCPICGDAYTSTTGHPHTVRSEDDYKALWGGRGDLDCIPMVGECGHEWEVCIGFHKGNSFIAVRVTV